MVQAAVDSEAITATVMDYFEGWFDGNTKRQAGLLRGSSDAIITRDQQWGLGHG